MQSYSGQENGQGQVNASCGQHPWPLFLPVIRWHPRGVNGKMKLFPVNIQDFYKWSIRQ
ncbi:hypothetical protein [Echinicola sp. 20G]|uniref:hypothetical protein n=1 Tax=Echinicola sp. 20G TaxID=2781961 RepID=UPI0019100F9E|nr:hypothetical protein [Echinicola sp. 20G]